MGAAKTKQVAMGGITWNVPVGSLDEPATWAREMMAAHEDPRHWKHAIREASFESSDVERIDEYARCLDFYVGGHERRTDSGRTFVGSRGYFHYVGI